LRTNCSERVVDFRLGGGRLEVESVLNVAAHGVPNELSGGGVAHRLDVVPVRADDESGVIVRVVFRAQAGRPLSCTGAQGRAIKGFDLLASLGGEADVK
jgi:hypothetical protein